MFGRRKYEELKQEMQSLKYDIDLLKSRNDNLKQMLVFMDEHSKYFMEYTISEVDKEDEILSKYKLQITKERVVTEFESLLIDLPSNLENKDYIIKLYVKNSNDEIVAVEHALLVFSEFKDSEIKDKGLISIPVFQRIKVKQTIYPIGE